MYGWKKVVRSSLGFEFNYTNMMSLESLVMVALILLESQLASTYRILGFHPIPGKSQHNIFAPILHQLAVRGHSVVYVTPVPPDLSHPNFEVRLIPQFKKKFHAIVQPNKLNELPPALATHTIYSAIKATASDMYGDAVAQELIHSKERFDAVTMESFLQEPVSALLHKFSCPAIDISALRSVPWTNELAGLPNNPAYQISFWTSFTNKMTFWERLHNFYVTWSTVLVSYYHMLGQQKIMDQYFNYTGWEDRPSIYQLVSNRSIILINQDPALGYSEPSPPHVKSVGGVNIVPNKPLPEDLEKWMNSASNGVIYFSLGSNLKTSEIVSTEFGESFIKVFRELPQKILMKWEKDDIPQGLPSNIFFYKWVPQQDVLAHKNCQLFITHGGFLSITEAVYYGVPILGIPFFGDQPSNMVYAENAGYGLKLYRDNVTYESVSWSLKELLSNSRYRHEARRRSSMLQDRKHTPLDESVYWIEHAIKYPNSLTPQSAFLNFFQLHLIDVVFFFLISIIISYVALKNIVLKIKIKFFRKNSKDKID